MKTTQRAKPVIPAAGVALAVALTLAFTFFLGCGSDDSTNPNGTTKYDTFEDVVNSGGEWVNEEVNPPDPEILDEEVEDRPEDGSLWVCQEKRVTLEENPKDFLLYQSGEGIYPGAVLQGGHLDENPPAEVIGERGTGRVFINLFTAQGTIPEGYQDISKVRQSEVNAAINALIQGRDLIPAQYVASVSQVHSNDHLRIEMGLSVSSFLDAGVSTDFGFDWSKDTSKWVIQLDQVFYEMIFEPPSGLNAWWASGVTPDDLDPYIGPNNPPVYVSSVRYGRKVYIAVESTSTDMDFKASLEASYRGAADVDFSVSSEYEKIVDTSKITAIVYGGSMSISALQGGDFQKLSQALNDGENIKLALPIAYTLKDLKKRQVVRVKEATVYDVRECEPVDRGLQDPLFVWDAESIVNPDKVSRSLGYDAGQDKYITKGPGSTYSNQSVVLSWKDIDEEDPLIDLTADSKDSAPTYIASAPGVEGPVVEFFHFHIGADEPVDPPLPAAQLRSQLEYNPVDLENTDYTLLMVMAMPPVTRFDIQVAPTANYQEYTAAPYVMYSDERTNWQVTGRNLLVGWAEGKVDDNCPFRFRHEGQSGGDVVLRASGNSYNVYAMRFSQENGMDLFVDGENVLSRSQATTPLDRYTLARLGAYVFEAENPPAARDAVLSRVRVRRVESYERALSDAQIEARSESMRRTYIH